MMRTIPPAGPALALAALLAVASPSVQAQPTRVTHVSGAIYLITGAGGNVAVSVGDSGILVVDTGSAGMSEALLAAIREISDGPIRYIINTGILPDRIGGNPAIRAAGETYTGGNAPVVAGVGVGAAVIAHENALLRIAAAPELSADAMPTDPFFVSKVDLYFNGEPVEIMYQPNAIDDTTLIVHFRRSDVAVAGDVFRLDRYPYFDIGNGGSINGVLAALNGLVDLAVADVLSEGGTLIVPGHGRISDEGDLVRYRDMVTIIRDRVQAWVDRGWSLEQVRAAQPSFEYDSRYGAATGEWTTDMFIEAVYRSLSTPVAGSTLSSSAR